MTKSQRKMAEKILRTLGGSRFARFYGEVTSGLRDTDESMFGLYLAGDVGTKEDMLEKIVELFDI